MTDGKPKTPDEVEQILRKLIVETLVLDSVAPESIDGRKPDFVIALGANSIDALEIILAAEERFGFEFEDHELRPELLSTLDHFVAEICRKIGVTVNRPAALETAAS